MVLLILQEDRLVFLGSDPTHNSVVAGSFQGDERQERNRALLLRMTTKIEHKTDFTCRWRPPFQTERTITCRRFGPVSATFLKGCHIHQRLAAPCGVLTAHLPGPTDRGGG